MAVTNYKKQEELAKQTTPVQSATPYNGLEGVSQNTANNLGNYQQGYKPSEQVTAAQQTLQQIQAQKPQGYTSKYQPALDNIMQQIQNPKEFKYEFNGDNLFKAYADLYTQKGKQASADAMGQAAGLTGGYGNSYGQNVGTQAYQQYLLSLYDKGLDLRDRAYQQYRDDQGALQDQYNILFDADNAGYDRFRDTVGDWQREEALAAERAQQAEDSDYDRYLDALNYYTGLAQTENADYRSEQERQEAIRQYEQNYARSVYENDRDFNANQAAREMSNARDIAIAILQNGNMPTAELLKAAGISEPDARAMMAQMMAGAGTGSGGSGGGGGRGGSGGQTEYFPTFDGKIYKMNKDGTYTEVSWDDVKESDKLNPTLGAQQELMSARYGAADFALNMMPEYRDLVAASNANKTSQNQSIFNSLEGPKDEFGSLNEAVMTPSLIERLKKGML
jgi:hypothetical protein